MMSVCVFVVFMDKNWFLVYLHTYYTHTYTIMQRDYVYGRAQ